MEQEEQAEQAEQAGQNEEQQVNAATGSQLAERHHRTSKHRAPQSSGRRPPRKAKAERNEGPIQRRLPFISTSSVISWLTPDVFTKRLMRAGGALVIGLFVIGAIVVAYHVIAGSKFFALRAVAVEGNKLLTHDQVESIVKSIADRGILRADLDQIREALKSNELILEADVSRMLPDMLRVSIKEREPFGLARKSDGTVVCVDQNGAMFGGKDLLRSTPMLPLISGLEEGGENASETNRQRLKAFQQLMADLDGAQPSLSSKIDEVIFDEAQGLRVILVDSGIAVFLGKEDFRARLNAALDVLDAVRRKDVEALNVLRIGDAEKLVSGAKIAYLNATIPKRVVVGLEE